MFSATANQYGYTNWWSKVEGEVRGRQDRRKENHVEYALTEFNELHITHIPNSENKLEKELSKGSS